MDFDKKLVESRGYGIYTSLDPSRLSNVYVAFDPKRAEVSGVYHQKLRVLFEEHAPDIVSAMSEFADLAQQANDALTSGRTEKLPALINANFDLRDKIFNVSDAKPQYGDTCTKCGMFRKICRFRWCHCRNL